MDLIKRNRLIETQSTLPEPQVIPIEEFFDGNDDIGSIACNRWPHPGIDIFRETFAKLATRPDVDGIYARISEFDPGEGSWPFADVVYVVGTTALDELQAVLEPLEADEVGSPGGIWCTGLDFAGEQWPCLDCLVGLEAWGGRLRRKVPRFCALPDISFLQSIGVGVI